jgi:hypothetical protein
MLVNTWDQRLWFELTVVVLVSFSAQNGSEKFRERAGQLALAKIVAGPH